MKFFVFAFATRDVREGSGLIGWRDHITLESRRAAELRRKELHADPPKEQRSRTLRRVIKSERWP